MGAAERARQSWQLIRLGTGAWHRNLAGDGCLAPGPSSGWAPGTRIQLEMGTWHRDQAGDERLALAPSWGQAPGTRTQLGTHIWHWHPPWGQDCHAGACPGDSRVTPVPGLGTAVSPQDLPCVTPMPVPALGLICWHWCPPWGQDGHPSTHLGDSSVTQCPPWKRECHLSATDTLAAVPTLGTGLAPWHPGLSLCPLPWGQDWHPGTAATQPCPRVTPGSRCRHLRYGVPVEGQTWGHPCAHLVPGALGTIFLGRFRVFLPDIFLSPPPPSVPPCQGSVPTLPWPLSLPSCPQPLHAPHPFCISPPPSVIYLLPKLYLFAVNT
ncbi:uncharacterized protein LOC115912573 [Camarhynchus parvulus]|uniref:uncharacterized protein LOC115912573 n=1 Tax=Geospiza parvula TaxID=87175 RepID=UPI001237B45B|nr:uncharacterized protein LOC115912573 [Camarhynchus parvulus]